ncbi:MAG: hypothetical protein MSR67_03895, partial [Oscillospiraceae bacterium]|nr:hypothetical protein [Oscillospiraceae bacterium]
MSFSEDNSNLISKEENAGKPVENKVEKDFKTRIYDFISDAGEMLFMALMKLVTLFVHGILHIIAAILRGFDRVKKHLARFFKKVWSVISAPFVRYFKAFKVGSAEISREKRESGSKASFGAFMRFLGRAIFGKRGLAVTVFNYALPVVSCIFLFNI